MPYWLLWRELFGLAGTVLSRSLNDDVIDKLLTLIVNDGKGPWVSDGVDRPAIPVSETFPYMEPPTNQSLDKHALDIVLDQTSK